MRIIAGALWTVFLLNSSLAQSQRTRNVAWFIPSTCSTSKINGLAIGPFSGCSENINTKRQVINGIDLEIFGLGFFLPLAGGYDATGNSFFYKGWKQVEVDTAPTFFTEVNGLVFSGGGIAGVDVKINGVSIAGIWQMTGKTNGLSIGGVFANMNRFVNGVSIGVFRNESIQTNGVQIGGITNASKRIRGIQIGLINRTDNLKGVQIGLWNQTGKLSLPFLNFGI